MKSSGEASVKNSLHVHLFFQSHVLSNSSQDLWIILNKSHDFLGGKQYWQESRHLYSGYNRGKRENILIWGGWGVELPL